MPSRSSIRLAAWNVNSIKVRLPHIIQWLASQEKAQTPIDALCLQELKLTDDKFPHRELEAAGYISLSNGQKTYNGVAILLRKSSLTSLASDPETAFLQVTKNIPNFSDEQQRILAATICFKEIPPIRIISAYFPNGQDPASDKFVYKLDWLSALRTWLAAELKVYPRLALLGDFNIAPEDRDVHDPKAWEGQNLVSPQEREQFRQLMQLGLYDSFRLFEQAPKTYSWWDYRMMAFRRNAGLRIDHVLLSQELNDKCIASTIDKTPRAWQQPSDHAPVIVELGQSAN
jgi:exodeoxyribonuclease-3